MPDGRTLYQLYHSPSRHSLVRVLMSIFDKVNRLYGEVNLEKGGTRLPDAAIFK